MIRLETDFGTSDTDTGENGPCETTQTSVLSGTEERRDKPRTRKRKMMGVEVKSKEIEEEYIILQELNPRGPLPDLSHNETGVTRT